MTLSALIHKGGLRQAATAIPATDATEERQKARTVARVATVAVANLPSHETDRLPDPAAETELRRLVNLVADANGFSPEDRREAVEVALRNPERALPCFRLLYAECSGTIH